MEENAFPTLVRRNFQIILDRYAFEILAEEHTTPINWVVILAASFLKIRIIQDRGQVFLDVAPENSKRWYDIFDVLHYLHSEADNPEWKYAQLEGMFDAKIYDQQLERLAKIISENLENILQLFDPQIFTWRNRFRFNRFINQREQKRMDQAFG